MKKIIILSAAFSPYLLFADHHPERIASGFSNFSGFFIWAQDLLVIVSQFILAAAVLYFLWNTFKFVKSAGDETEREKSKGGMIWGIIGIAVMVSMWGLVRLITNSLDLEKSSINTIIIPKL